MKLGSATMLFASCSTEQQQQSLSFLSKLFCPQKEEHNSVKKWCSGSPFSDLQPIFFIA